MFGSPSICLLRWEKLSLIKHFSGKFSSHSAAADNWRKFLNFPKGFEGSNSVFMLSIYFLHISSVGGGKESVEMWTLWACFVHIRPSRQAQRFLSLHFRFDSARNRTTVFAGFHQHRLIDSTFRSIPSRAVKMLPRLLNSQDFRASGCCFTSLAKNTQDDDVSTRLRQRLRVA